MQTKDLNEASTSLQGSGLSPFLLWLIWVIWLPFAIPDIIGFFQSHPPLVRLIATLVAVALFFAVYIWATWRNVQHLVGGVAPTGRWQVSLWLPIAVLVALSLTIVLLYRGIGTPFIFTSAYMAGRLPTGRAIQAVAALALLIAVFGLRDPNWSYLGQGIALVLVVGIVTISMVRAVTTGRELRAAREEIARLAVMTERLRIARDLHDLLGHNLSLIALKSELAGRLIGVAPERATIEIGDVERVARSTLQEVREAVSAYRQPTLSSELHAAHEILFAAGIAYRYEGNESTMGTLPTAVETLLSWAMREGVTNVIRHSRARQCTVRMRRESYSACVEVIDDGVARPQDTASRGGNGSGGNGLRGLAERVEALDGSFEAGPRTGGGYRLAVSVPVVQSERSDNHAERSEQR